MGKRYVCPVCGEPVENFFPTDWLLQWDIKKWRHELDGMSLCPVACCDGIAPADPVEVK